MTSPSSDRPGVVAPPPLIYFAGIVVGWALSFLWPLHLTAHRAWIAGASLAALSGGLALWAVYTMHAAGTHIDPNQPAVRLVRQGPFRWTRNPIYVSLTGFTAGIALLADNAWILGLLVPVLLIMQVGVIRREERYLEKKFGDEYRRFLKEVRRWL
ncbi:MAG: isoprenylcysteine carboxylmethyltransferase family protein [Firmicutes bacterium]|nr:isoprenylcysteine carboxylmethyltransferase family protein [Bacillota bacterium]